MSVARLDLAGELTIHTAAEQCQRVLAALDEKTTLRIRLAGISEMDTAGLQVLLLARREAERLGGAVEIREPSEAVVDLLAVAHLTETLQPAVPR